MNGWTQCLQLCKPVQNMNGHEFFYMKANLSLWAPPENKNEFWAWTLVFGSLRSDKIIIVQVNVFLFSVLENNYSLQYCLFTVVGSQCLVLTFTICDPFQTSEIERSSIQPAQGHRYELSRTKYFYKPILEKLNGCHSDCVLNWGNYLNTLLFKPFIFKTDKRVNRYGV